QFVALMRKEPGLAKGQVGMLPSSIKVRLQFLHTALQWAADQKLIPDCPSFPTIKVPKKDPQPVATELFERLLAAAGDDRQMAAYLLCGWRAGLRLTEALALEWQETTGAPYLDFARDRIILPAEFVKATRDQWLPLDPVLRQALEALARHGKKVFCFLDAQGRALTASGVSQRVRSLAKKARVRLTMKPLPRGFGCRYPSKLS